MIYKLWIFKKPFLVIKIKKKKYNVNNATYLQIDKFLTIVHGFFSKFPTEKKIVILILQLLLKLLLKMLSEIILQ